MPPIEGAREIFCPICRTKWETARLSAKDQVLSCPEPLGGLASLVKYNAGQVEGVPEKLIFRLKHKDEARVFRYVAKEMVPLIEQWLTAQGVENRQVLLTYPPRRPSAIRKDGFDQAQRLTKAISRQGGWQMADLLVRTRHKVKAQKTLNAIEREESAAMSYGLASDCEIPPHTVVILIDDLHTTGATLNAAGRLLLQAGASRVLFATVGRTVTDTAKPRKQRKS